MKILLTFILLAVSTLAFSQVVPVAGDSVKQKADSIRREKDAADYLAYKIKQSKTRDSLRVVNGLPPLTPAKKKSKPKQ